MPGEKLSVGLTKPIKVYWFTSHALMTAWNLSHHLAKHLQLSEIEKRFFCLGLTLHDYNKYIQGQEKKHSLRKLMRYQQF